MSCRIFPLLYLIRLLDEVGEGMGCAGSVNKYQVGTVTTETLPLCEWVGCIGVHHPSNPFHHKAFLSNEFLSSLSLVESNGQYYALRKYSLGALIQKNCLHRVKHELEAMKQLDSPFISGLFTQWFDNSSAYLVLEYAVGGTLRTNLETRGTYSPQEARFYASEVAVALHHIHQKDLVYRGLSTNHVMIDETGHIKLFDLSLSRAVGPKGNRTTLALPSTTTACLTNVPGKTETMGGEQLPYLPPEALDRQHGHMYGQPVDWWSFGCLVYELLLGIPPFGMDLPTMEILNRIHTCTVHYNLSLGRDAKSCIQACLKLNSSKRATWETIRDHPWFRMIPWKLVEDQSIVPPFVPGRLNAGDASNWFASHTTLPPDQFITPEERRQVKRVFGGVFR